MIATSAATASTAAVTVVAGIPIPSTSPLFLGIVAVHVIFGVICVIAGAVAMLSVKAPGRHPRFGTLYLWGLGTLFVSATALAAMRWAEDRVLFLLGALAFGLALAGRTAMHRRWPGWLRLHVTGMGTSYVVLLTAFYVDNGRNLPIWRMLPTLAYWLAPIAVGLPLIVYAMLRHPLVRRGP
jgi:hypothetical protein